MINKMTEQPRQESENSTTSICRINYESDFALELVFQGGRVPIHPWMIELFTPNTDAYNIYQEVFFDGIEFHNCKVIDDNTILVFVDHHHLSPGLLQFKLKTYVPSKYFPDGKFDLVIPGGISVELWRGPSDDSVISGEITAVSAQIEEYDSFESFPDPGKAGHLYIDREANKIYRWDTALERYLCVGSDYNDIEVIDGGNAFGLKNRT